ncbi:MAG: hypothetical protein ACRD3O_13090, partial [Terriglobia bacterium]
LRRMERGFLVEPAEGESGVKPVFPGGERLTGAESSLPAGGSAASSSGESAPLPVAPIAEALSLLKQALAAAAEKSPGRPLYLRQLRQRLRALDPAFDEQRYGFRGTLDFLHEAQREGCVKLLRDHKGVWRIHPVLAAGSSPSNASSESENAVAAAPETDPMAMPAVNEPPPVTEPVEEETVATEIPLPFVDITESVSDIISGQEIQPSQPRGRKPRSAKAAGPRGRRPSPSRRKSTPPKEA